MTLRELSKAKQDLEHIAECIALTDTPHLTMDYASQSLGAWRVVELVAMVINAKAWDGRISEKNKAWAKTKTAESVNSDSVHMAHIDQIATFLRNSGY